MKICAAQIKPFKGDIEKNIALHLYAIEQAGKEQADIIVFPELSLTAYEPALTRSLAIDKDDERLGILQQKSAEHNLIITVGAPLKKEAEICIGMLIFQPGKPVEVYTKQFLHPDEYPFFAGGNGGGLLLAGDNTISLAICYEVFVPEHNAAAIKNNSDFYIASVAKSAKGMAKAYATLPGIAPGANMAIVVVNSVGYCDNFESAGQSVVWNNKGKVLDQLKSTEQALLFVDTVNNSSFRKFL